MRMLLVSICGPLGVPSRATDTLCQPPTQTFRIDTRVRRPSRSLPLVALLAQVGLGGAIGGFCLYSYTLNANADAGVPWAVDALQASDSWLFGLFGRLWGRPPGGPVALLLAAGPGLNAIRCLPLLFDRLVVPRLPDSNASNVGEVE